MNWEIRQGDALERLREMPDESVHCCVTSPPYWGLRDYGLEPSEWPAVEYQMPGGTISVPAMRCCFGLEDTPEQFIGHAVLIFEEVRRVLRADGTCWVNIGDSYAGQRDSGRVKAPGCKPKDLVGIPWMLAFTLRADGWYLRRDIIWAKPNPMPESVTDRPTSSHEYLFLLTKSARYFYDAEAIREPDKGRDHARQVLSGQPSLEPSNGLASPHRGLRTPAGRDGLGRNKRSVWTIATRPYPDAHFATFPPDLVQPCILAGTPPKVCGECGAPWVRQVERASYGSYHDHDDDLARGHRQTRGMNGREFAANYTPPRTTGWQPTCDHEDDSGRAVVLDPFAGAATTGLVAARHNRDFIGIELNPEYVEMGRARIRDDAPLLNTPAEVRTRGDLRGGATNQMTVEDVISDIEGRAV